ncbi:MAG: ABC transporter permease [Gemmatimonadota bacterium]
MLGNLTMDVRLTLRKLARAPGFAFVVLLTLALGIGANTAIFTLVDGILLRPLPFPQPDRLVRVYQTAPERGVMRGSLSLPDGRDWGRRAQLLESLGLYSTMPSGLVYTGGHQARELKTAYVSGGFFPTLGVPALRGRTLWPDEEQGDNRVVVLSYDYWTRELGADPAIVGRTLDMEGSAFRVVGVMPPDFAFPRPDVEVWTFLTVIPSSSIPLEVRSVRLLNAVARLAPGASLAQARSDLSAVARGVHEEFRPGSPESVGADLVPLRQAMVGDTRTALLVLLGAVGLILVIACANVASLLLARGIGRTQEMALRVALGARRARLVRQLITESIVLGLAGGALGLLLAWAGVRAFVARNAGLLPRTWELGIRWEVLLFALGVSLLAAVAFGLLPAVTASATDPGRGLKAGRSRGSTEGGRHRLRQAMVTAQVAVAVVLLVGAGLMARSLARINNVDPGFRARGLLGVTLTLSDVLYRENADFSAAYHTLLDRLRALPGVEGAAAIRYLPMQGAGEQLDYTVPGEAPPPAGQEPRAWTLQASDGLFRVMGIPLVSGRTFTTEDRAGSPPVAVINETLARQAFGGAEAVGRSLSWWGEETRIVGVVGDVHQASLRDAPVPTIYLPQDQVFRSAMTFVLRTTGNPLRLAGSAQSVVRELNPGQPITAMVDVAEVVGGSTARSRFLTLLLGAFALLAFMLAALGVYGVVAHMVARQTHEIGIRMALGAGPATATGLILRRSMAPVAAGLAVGLLLALLLTRSIQGLLFRVAATDPASYILAGSLLAAAALAATFVPIRRALRIDPGDLLRRE